MEVAQVIEALSKVAWPLLLAIVLWKLYPVARSVLDSRAFTVKVGDFQLSVQAATEQLQTTVEDLQQKLSQLRADFDRGSPKASTGLKEDRAVQGGDETGWFAATTPTSLARSVVWVDDKPEEKAFYITQLRSEGIEVVEQRSTNQAIDYLSENPAATGVVITNMGRWEDNVFNHEAAFDLIKTLRSTGVSIPIIVFTDKRKTARYKQGIEAVGGNGITWSPVEVLENLHRLIPPRG